MQKSTVEEIRQRFNHDVERFSNLETGQSATVDSPLCLELVTQAAAALTPQARDVLDIGCGAGNYTLKMLERIPDLNCTLADLSLPMLERARQRVSAATKGAITTLQGDMRELDFGAGKFDIVLASATLHHLRGDEEWQSVFAKIFAALRPGGSFLVFDMIEQVNAGVQQLMRQRWGDYLVNYKGGGSDGEKYRDSVFAYVEKEDTPRPLMYQIDLLRQVGFKDVDILHKNAVFAAFVGRK